MCWRITEVLLVLCLLLNHYESAVNAMPYSGDHSDAEIVVVRERVRYSEPDETKAGTAIPAIEAQTTAKDNVDNESVMDTADDLIFLAKKPIQQQEREGDGTEATATATTQSTQNQEQQQQQQQKQAKQSIEVYQQIDLLTSDEEDTLLSTSKEEQQQQEKQQNHQIDGSPQKIELDTDDEDDQTTTADTPTQPPADVVKPIDMSAFMAVIPASEVKKIAIQFYYSDLRVQRIYAFLLSPEFQMLRRTVLAQPEIEAFLEYFNSNGLDLVEFTYALVNLTSEAPLVHAKKTETKVVNGNDGATTKAIGNEIDQNQNPNNFNNCATTEAKTTPKPVTTTERMYYGLEGLVDKTLAVLPQDQIFAVFFDKLETDAQFAKLVDSLSKPEFSRILSDIQNSHPLRHLIFTLDNNNIFLSKVADSLKAYFILGNFK